MEKTDINRLLNNEGLYRVILGHPVCPLDKIEKIAAYHTLRAADRYDLTCHLLDTRVIGIKLLLCLLPLIITRIPSGSLLDNTLGLVHLLRHLSPGVGLHTTLFQFCRGQFGSPSELEAGPAE